MHAIILAGGRGERLMPLTESVPKPMVKIDGKPILEHQIRQLKESGINNIIICEAYRSDVIQDYFGDGKKFGVDIKHLVLDQGLGSAGSIKHALQNIPDSEANTLVLYGDIISDVDLKKLSQEHIARNALLTAVSIPVKFPYGVWENDNKGRVKSFSEKPYINTNSGIFAINRGIRDFLTDGKDFFNGTVVPLVEGGKQSTRGTGIVQTFSHDGYWRDIATKDNRDDCETEANQWKINEQHSVNPEQR